MLVKLHCMNHSWGVLDVMLIACLLLGQYSYFCQVKECSCGVNDVRLHECCICVQGGIAGLQQLHQPWR